MKKSIIRFVAVVLSAVVTLAVMGCKNSSDNEPAVTPEVNPGDVVSRGIKIAGTTYRKTSEVAIVPAGTTGVVDMKDDSSWDTYVADSAASDWKGVFIKDRKVTLSPFVMSQYEVTQELYIAVMGVENPSDFNVNAAEGEIQELRPVETITHYEAVAFCNELTKKTMSANNVVYFSDEAKTTAYTKDDATAKKTPYMDITKKGYRLPTEAEWEYAARGGNPQAEAWKNAFGSVTTKEGVIIYDGEDYLEEDENLATVGWYKINAGRNTHEVGLKDKNSLNIYDMAGNVCEMCWDWYAADVETGAVANPSGASSGDYRICRGGGYRSRAYRCTSSMRILAYPNEMSGDLGFRVCRSIN